MKAVIRSCKPYWLYLIVKGIKTIEVSKTKPQSEYWNQTVYMYCSKDKKSLNRIPKEDREWFSQFLGKVVCGFVCVEINEFKVFENETVQNWNYYNLEDSCLTYDELVNYIGLEKYGYAWYINDLKIYDEPKKLSDFHKALEYDNEGFLNCTPKDIDFICQSIQDRCINNWEILQQLYIQLTRPPQSWQYCEELEER